MTRRQHCCTARRRHSALSTDRCRQLGWQLSAQNMHGPQWSSKVREDWEFICGTDTRHQRPRWEGQRMPTRL